MTGVIVTDAGFGYTGVPEFEIDPPTGVILAGQTNSVFTITGVSTNDAGNYFVVVTNNFGSATSMLAVLTVNLATSNILQNPTGPSLFAAVQGGGMHLQLTGAANGSYAVLTATNLAPPVQWQPIATNSADAQGTWQFTDTNLLGSQKFYRVVSQ